MGWGRKVLIAGGYGTGNLGDEAILLGILNTLNNDRNYDKNGIVVFSRSPHETKFFHRIDARRRNPFDLLVSNEVIIGGGELFQDLGNNALKYSILGLIAKILRKRVIFYAVGVSSIRDSIGKFLTRLSLNVADKISVRDRASKKRLRHLGVNKTITVVDDPSLHVEPISCELAFRLFRREGVTLDERKFLVGITSQYIPDRELNRRTHIFILRFLRRVLTKYADMYVIFIPFNNNIDNRLDRDIIYGEWLDKRLDNDRFKVLRNKYTPREMMGMFKLLSIVISTRLHPLIFASKVNVPAIGLDISPKVVSFCKDHDFLVVKIGELKRLCHLTDNLAPT